MAMSTEESIGLTPRGPYLNDANAQSDPRLSASDTLLEGDSEASTDAILRRPRWMRIFSSKGNSRPRRRTLRARNGVSEKNILSGGKRFRICFKAGFGILVILGIVQLFSLIGSLIINFLPQGVHRIVDSWGRPGHIGASLASWPTDFSRDIIPIRCHSHNDYWRRVPLYSAIEAGCIGVEADVWLFEEELFVGHSVASLTPNRTLNSLYIHPILEILSRQNPKTTLLPEGDHQPHGVFDTDPEQSLILLIDFKTAGKRLWPYVQSALEPLRSQNYLTRANGTQIIPGPITVVGTGNTPFDLVDSDESNPHHDVFFDAPLADMYEPANGASGVPYTEDTITTHRRSDEAGQGHSGTTGNPDAFTASNSYYASVDFGSAIGTLWTGELSDDQMVRLRGQIRGAHKRGLKARYWGLPFWPISLRNHVWKVLVKEGVDLLNVDDLKGATRRNWKRHDGWWKRMKGVTYDIHDGVKDSVGGPAGSTF